MDDDLRRIAITGATGSLGLYTTRYLIDTGFDVTAIVRDSGKTQLLPDDVNCVIADVTRLDSLVEAFKNQDAVVHLAVAKSDEKFSYDVNVVGARNIIAACHYCNVKRIVNVSTQSAKIDRKGLYGKTKALADEAFQSSGMAVVTLRASIVYGPDLLGVFGQLVDAVRNLPVVPVIGNGKWRSRPLHVRDLSFAIKAVLENPNTVGKTYDLVGPDEVKFDQLIDLVSSELGHSRPKLHIPYQAVLPVVWLMARLLKNFPVTVSNVLGSNQNVEFDGDALGRDIDFSPMPIAQGLKEVLTDV